jgi:NAD(P)-dependent dehydrogenase (short-subunit alcohol dehydrogenase family)
MSRTNGRPEVVVITGASAGVGRATARAFAKRGAHIGLLARGEAGLEGAAGDVERLGGRALAIPTDVADAEAVEAAAQAVEDEFGPIDIWVNNAMASVFAPFKKLNADEFERVTDVTYHGYVYGTMAALKRMLPRDRGTIVQVGSALAYRSIPLQSAYCGAKHAIVGFTDSIRCELVHDESNVHITAVHMPALNTPQFGWVESRLPKHPQPVPPIYQPEVAADAIYFAAHERRREVWVGTPTWKAIVGQKFIPGLLDIYLGKTGYSGQQTDELPPTEDDNIWDPVDDDRDYGAHGSFDGKSRTTSPGLWMSKHRNWLAAGAGAVAAVALGLVGRSS